MGYTGAYDLGNGLDVSPDDDEPEYCSVCGAELDYVDCWYCHGEGGRDLYEENPLESYPGEWEMCPECHGEGGYLECPDLPHNTKQEAQGYGQ